MEHLTTLISQIPPHHQAFLYSGTEAPSFFLEEVKRKNLSKWPNWFNLLKSVATTRSSTLTTQATCTQWKVQESIQFWVSSRKIQSSASEVLKNFMISLTLKDSRSNWTAKAKRCRYSANWTQYQSGHTDSSWEKIQRWHTGDCTSNWRR